MIGARWIAVSVLASLAACVSPPPFTLREENLVVRAKDEKLARLVLREVRDVRARLADRIPDLSDRPVEIWLQERLASGFVGSRSRSTTLGFTLEPWIGDAPEIHLLENEWVSPLPHELTHASLGPTWDALPGIVQEGLCDLMAEELGPFPGLRELRVRHAARASSLHAMFAWNGPSSEPSKEHGRARRSTLSVATGLPVAERPADLDRALTLPLRARWRSRAAEDVGHLYGLGYVLARWIVERGGVVALHELCVRTREAGYDLVPAAWLRAAAGVEDADALARRLEHEVDVVHVRELERGGELGSWVRTSRAQSDVADESVDAWLAYAQPTLSLGGRAEKPLQEVEGVIDWLRARWDELKPERVEGE